MEPGETSRVREWVDQAVVGLGLCPFAAEPIKAGRVRMTVSQATSEEMLLDDLYTELKKLSNADSSAFETTLLIIPNLLQDFADYNQFLDRAESLIEQHCWTGELQILQSSSVVQ